MARRVVRTKTEQTLARIARAVAWSREPYDCIIGEAPIGAIPLGRVATVRGSLRRHAYAAMVEADDEQTTRAAQNRKGCPN